jgi:hypothetical protein
MVKKPKLLAVYLSMKYERLKEKNVTSVGLEILYCHLSGNYNKTLNLIV